MDGPQSTADLLRRLGAKKRTDPRAWPRLADRRTKSRFCLPCPCLCFSPPCFKSSFCVTSFYGQRPSVQQEKRRKERLLSPSS